MPTIAGTLRPTAARVPKREALIFGDVRYTYAELNVHVDHVAAVLLERGIAKGERLMLMSTNSDRLVIAFYAAHRVGVCVRRTPRLYFKRLSTINRLTFGHALD